MAGMWFLVLIIVKMFLGRGKAHTFLSLGNNFDEVTIVRRFSGEVNGRE